MALTALAACHSASTASAPKPIKGGTLNVILSNYPINNLDPQEISLANDTNISHLINRTLTTTNAAGAIVPDLATDTGRPSDGNKVWEFTLKPNVKWQDGSAVTCPDVRYGIERRFAKVIDAAGGLGYPLTYLEDNKPAYTGPFLQSAKLNSIDCVDASTVRFTLKRPYGDFGYTVSVSAFAPMQDKHDDDHAADGKATSTDYDPFSNGPYQVDPSQTVTQKDPDTGSYFSTKLVLVRNQYWNPATDPVRKAYPNQISITFDAQKPKITNALILSATPLYKNAINLDSDVSSQFVQQVINDPSLSKRAVGGFEGATRYFAINQRKITSLTCRRALEWGFDKYAWRYEAGGAVFGQLATSMIPPNLLAHANFDLYKTNTEPSGDYKTAAALWKQGNCPATISIAFPNAGGYPQQMSTVVQAYQKASINVKLVPLPQAVYYGHISDPNESYDMTLAGWVPDWANGSAVIPPLFSSSSVTAALNDPNEIRSNYNFSMLTSTKIDTAINDAFKTSDLSVQYKLWGQLDKTIIDQAYAIPVLFQRGLRMMGTNVRGAVMSPAFGEPDLSAIGVAS